MKFTAKACFIRLSPMKLRPIVDVVRGKGAQYALNWLAVHRTKKAMPVRKVLASAVANAKDRGSVDAAQLKIADIRVDQGPSFKYYKPGAMGRTGMYKRRLSHISVVLESTEEERG